MHKLGASRINAAVVCSMLVLAGCQTSPVTTSMSLGASKGATYDVLNSKGGNNNGRDDRGNDSRGGSRDPRCTVTPPPQASQCRPDPYVIYSHNSCDDLSCSGHGNTIDGDCHTNAGCDFTGNRNRVTGNCEHVRDNRVRGKDNDCGRDQRSQASSYPGQAYSVASFGKPTFQFKGDVDLRSVPSVWANKTTLKPGVYCTTGKLTISGDKVCGEVTLIGDSVHLTGSSCSLQAHSNGVLCFATGKAKDAVCITGSKGDYRGHCIAYSGGCQVRGSNNDCTGYIHCDHFDCAGSENHFCREQHNDCASPKPTPTPTPARPTPTPTPVLGGTPEPTPTPVPSSAPTSPPPGDGGPVLGGGDPSPTPPAVETPPPGSKYLWAMPNGWNPWAVAIDPLQNLWITCINGLQTAGLEMDNMGAVQGTTLAGFDCRGVAIDPRTQHAWYTSRNDGTAREFDQQRNQVQLVATGGNPEGLAFDNNGVLWIADSTGGVLLGVDPTTGSITRTLGGFSQPRRIAVDKNNVLWVTDRGSNSLCRVDCGTGQIKRIAVPTAPSGVTIDRDGNVWTANLGSEIPIAQASDGGTTVSKVSPAGTLLGTFDCGGISPYGITTDSQGNVLVVNQTTNNLTKLSLSGSVLASYPTDTTPTDVVVDASGWAWITCYNAATIDQIYP